MPKWNLLRKRKLEKLFSIVYCGNMNKFNIKIAIDLVPMLPGAENGGIKILVCELLSILPKIAPDILWILLTSDDTHEDLKDYECNNVIRICVNKRHDLKNSFFIFHVLISFAKKILPLKVKKIIKQYFHTKTHNDHLNFLENNNVSLIFCPFMTSFFNNHNIPIVAIVADLQSLYNPNFFSKKENLNREINYKKIFYKAHGVITISNFVKTTILDKFNFPDNKIKVISIQTAERFPKPDYTRIKELEHIFKIKINAYFIYPANAWEHKNHNTLFKAWKILVQDLRFRDIKLICTGENNAKMHTLVGTVTKLELQNNIIFPGFLPDKDFCTLLSHSMGMIFPSLYEGFGMPVIEAMRQGIPVLCSNSTSLPEVGGDAVLMFDPLNPKSIVTSIIKIMTDKSLRQNLSVKGIIRAELYNKPYQMGQEYLNFFLDVI